jgi:hypothetical protein
MDQYFRLAVEDHSGPAKFSIQLDAPLLLRLN